MDIHDGMVKIVKKGCFMKISEMTMRGPNLAKQGEIYANNNKNLWLTQGKHIADIENYKVIKYETYYSLWDNNNLIFFCSLSDDNTVDDVYIVPQYRGKKIFSMMLWFFKTRLNKSPLILGKVHSTMMQEIVKGLSRFNKYWYNIKTKDTVPFSLDNLDNFYSYLQPTDWRLILENSGEFNWPMYNIKGFVKESYEPYLD